MIFLAFTQSQTMPIPFEKGYIIKEISICCIPTYLI